MVLILSTGFPTNAGSNYLYPHLGYVYIGNNCSIGSNCTVDRGKIDITLINDNCMLDNLIHVGHNVCINKNTTIAAQTGISGSVFIDNDVIIGGQAGVSGHLKIGNNIQIGGGSGVIKNIPDNSKVMGYPAKDIRKFIKENKFND